jgi:hypothetical protein
MIDEGKVKQRLTLEPPYVLKLMQERYGNSNMEKLVNDAFRIYKVTGQPLAMVAGLLHAFCKIDLKKAAEFSDAWENGYQGGRLGVIRRVQKHLDQIKKQSNGRVNDVVRCALYVEAWNHFVTGSKVNFSWTMTEPFPEIAKPAA